MAGWPAARPDRLLGPAMIRADGRPGHGCHRRLNETGSRTVTRRWTVTRCRTVTRRWIAGKGGGTRHDATPPPRRAAAAEVCRICARRQGARLPQPPTSASGPPSPAGAGLPGRGCLGDGPLTVAGLLPRSTGAGGSSGWQRVAAEAEARRLAAAAAAAGGGRQTGRRPQPPASAASGCAVVVYVQ